MPTKLEIAIAKCKASADKRAEQERSYYPEIDMLASIRRALVPVGNTLVPVDRRRSTITSVRAILLDLERKIRREPDEKT